MMRMEGSWGKKGPGLADMRRRRFKRISKNKDDAADEMMRDFGDEDWYFFCT